jgi:hypothetical protein
MFRTALPALALGLASIPAQAQFPGHHPPHHPVPVYSPPLPYPARFAPPVYTMDDFVKCFRPTEGHHRIWIVHPRTGRPVEVCFTLPCGRLREVEVNRGSIEFEYRDARDVRLVFHHDGTVSVR